MTFAAIQSVPFIDLARHDEEFLSQAESAFARIARSGAFTLGEDLERFEAAFAAYCGTAECVGVSDGTEALRLALLAVGAGPGGEVVTVPHTFVATVEAIAMTGARPVLVDIDPETMCMSPKALAGALTPNTAAVVPVHLYGRPAPMEALLAASGGVPVVEDAAQAHGATLGQRRAGSLGAAGAFSFYPTKNLGAMGDGGAVVCDDGELAARVRSLRHHGSAPGDANRHVLPGATSRLDNLQAALLMLKLDRLEAWNAERRRVADCYRQALGGLPVRLPPGDPPDGRHVYHLFVVELENRDDVLAALRARGVGAAVHYPTPVHLQPAWRDLGHGPGDFPAAEAAAERVLSLPIFPGITDDEVDRVTTALGEVLGAAS